MSVSDDIHIHEPRFDVPRYEFRGLRDLALVVCLTILTVLALHALDTTGVAGIGTSTVVQDWKGNSGSLPARL